MATRAPSRVTAASLELSSLSQASYKAAEQLTSILNAAEVRAHVNNCTQCLYLFVCQDLVVPQRDIPTLMNINGIICMLFEGAPY